MKQGLKLNHVQHEKFHTEQTPIKYQEISEKMYRTICNGWGRPPWQNVMHDSSRGDVPRENTCILVYYYPKQALEMAINIEMGLLKKGFVAIQISSQAPQL